MNRTHILNDPSFWQHFQQKVHSKSWKCSIPADVLFHDLTQDAKLYKDNTIFTQRRELLIPWIDNDHQWNSAILGACNELTTNQQQQGIHCRILKNLHVFEALKDFVEHLHCFYTVASTMSVQGYSFQPISQYSSRIHDMDKLDPVMLLGYSERFEDGVSTSVWELCVDRHVHVNPHHQVHGLWHKCEEDTAVLTCGADALREMVCDKVSRRLQKNLGGVVCSGMWDVDEVFFDGLPEHWMQKAGDMMKLLKQNGVVI